MAQINTEDHRGDLGLFEHTLAKKGSKIQVYIKVLEIETGVKLDRSKTIGTITTKNSGKILMSANSGYSTGPKRENSCLDTNKWNLIALHHIAKKIGFKFPKNIRDNARNPILEQHVGRAHAGHVEVLLASWLVIHLLRREPDLADKSEKHLVTQLKRLNGKDLGDARISFITIDSEPCRTCLQFLYKLSEYTSIIFVIFGSRGIGPIQVRIDGQRRQDVVGDFFCDSEDETQSPEPNTQAEESPNNVISGNTAISDILTPATPAPKQLVPRRPQSSWGKAVQWTPENPDELLSSYKKKTPVFEFPGYDGELRRNSATPSPSYRVQAEEGERMAHGVMEHDSLDEWDDLGEGLLICRKNTTNNQDDNQVKCEQSVDSSPSTSTASSGHTYARAAYQTIEEMEMCEYEVVERPRNPEEYAQSLPSTRFLRRLPPVNVPRLQRFRHRAIDNSDESILKSRYSILNPKHRR
ncbi:hypothetical protein F4801DRAFT_467681 [Xylaria longipes]|nr:hypothetical protein F4801DRAFT_467681 [Xylaria longipes]